MQTLIDFGEYSEKELKLRRLLEPYIPKESLLYVCRYFATREVDLKITRSRRTKYGDFRASLTGKKHMITINSDLNPFTFLITLIHEAAHLDCWLQYKNRVKPHGKEWKYFFKELMQPYVKLDLFPGEVIIALKNYLKNPAASSCSDQALMKALKAHNENASETCHLEELPENSIFMLTNFRVFQKGEKRRKLFLCKDLNNKKDYLINPLCEVILLNNSGV